MGFLSNLFSSFSAEPAQQAAQAQILGLQNAQNSANAALGGGLATSNNYLTGASNLYKPLSALATKGTTSYADALGLNGVAGSDAARAAFTGMPGYQEGLNTGLDQLDRRAAARGQLGSGNTSADTIKYATDYANQNYGNYLSNLAPFLGLNQNVTGAQAGILGQQGANALDVAKLQGGIGFQTQQGIGNANAQSAMAPYNASSNFLNTLLGVGKLAAPFIPGFGGGGQTGGSNPAWSGYNMTGLGVP